MINSIFKKIKVYFFWHLIEQFRLYLECFIYLGELPMTEVLSIIKVGFEMEDALVQAPSGLFGLCIG